jgi:hypothetical protein
MTGAIIFILLNIAIWVIDWHSLSAVICAPISTTQHLLCNAWGNLALTIRQKCQCQLMIRIIGIIRITTIVNNHLHDLLFATLTSQNRQTDKQVVVTENVNLSEAMYDLLCSFATTFFVWIFHNCRNGCEWNKGFVRIKGVSQCYFLHSPPPDTYSSYHIIS